jgi:hypothetical protein
MSKTSDNRCFRKAQERGDETFTLVGQDQSSPKVVCEWIKENIDTAPVSKLEEALYCAIEMRNAKNRKVAD